MSRYEQILVSRRDAFSRVFGTVLCAFVFLAGATVTYGAPPVLSSVQPRGFPRGTPTTLVLTGEAIGRGEVEILTNLPGTIGAIKVEDPNKISFPLITPATAATGYYAIQARTADGLTGRMIVALGDRPEISEREPNDEFAAAQPVSPPVSIVGTCGGSDRDHFRFHAKKGETFAVEVEARRLGGGLDPVLTILDTTGVQIAGDRESIALDRGDRKLTFQAPVEGDFIAVLNDIRYAGEGDPIYRVKIASNPSVDEVFPMYARRGTRIDLGFAGIGSDQIIKTSWGAPSDDAIAWVWVSPPAPAVGGPFRITLTDTPQEIEPESPGIHPWTFGAAMNGRISAPGQVDRYKIRVTPGRTLVFEVLASRLGSRLDGFLRIAKPDGGVLAEADDGAGIDPRLNFNVPAGVEEVVVSVFDLTKQGGVRYGYQLKAYTETSDFSILVDGAAITIPAGGTTNVAVRVDRRGYNDAIQLSVPYELSGISASGGLIAAGAAIGTLTIAADEGSASRLVPLEIWGTTGSPSRPRRVKARLGGDGTPYPPQRPTELVAAIGAGPPVSLAVEPRNYTFIHGQSAKLTVTATRRGGFNEPINLTTVGLPPGIGGGNATISAGQNQATLDFGVIDPNAALVNANLQITAKTRFNGRDETVLAAPVAARVVRPFSFELLTPNPTVVVGGETTLFGVVRRVAPFQGEVRIAAEGSLPAHVVVAPAKLGPGESVAQIKLSADPQAAPGDFSLLLRSATDVDGRKQTKDYLIPDITVKATVVKPSSAPQASK
jgi:hypothetical protein